MKQIRYAGRRPFLSDIVPMNEGAMPWKIWWWLVGNSSLSSKTDHVYGDTQIDFANRDMKVSG